jgi:membrane fusion protein, multidrug efflux system
MKFALRITIALLILAGIGGGLVWGFLAGRSEQAAEAESDAPIEAASRVTHEDGKTVLAFDPPAQRVNGIALVTLGADKRSAASQANGVVLQLQPLLDLKTSFNAAQMDIVKARAASQASQAEYKRLLGLNQEGQNVSEKAIETARAAAESDLAVLENAQQSLVVLKSSMQLHWGTVLAGWLEQDSPELDALLAQRTFLLQVTATAGASQLAPKQAIAQLPDGTHISAQLVGTLPLLDPRLQAVSYLYIVSAHPELIPGINLPVSLPAGPPRGGVVVPYGAVVWWQGGAWCYVEEAPGKFTRAEVSTTNPAPTGWFVSEGIPAGTQVVTAGAQTLLSEEFRSQIQTDED